MLDWVVMESWNPDELERIKLLLCRVKQTISSGPCWNEKKEHSPFKSELSAYFLPEAAYSNTLGFCFVIRIGLTNLLTPTPLMGFIIVSDQLLFQPPDWLLAQSVDCLLAIILLLF